MGPDKQSHTFSWRPVGASWFYGNPIYSCEVLPRGEDGAMLYIKRKLLRAESVPGKVDPVAINIMWSHVSDWLSGDCTAFASIEEAIRYANQVMLNDEVELLERDPNCFEWGDDGRLKQTGDTVSVLVSTWAGKTLAVPVPAFKRFDLPH